MLAVAMGCWYGERHANIPVFRGCFSHERHVSGEPVVPEPGIPIIRGWRTSEPVAVVLFQIDNARRCRVLYEHPPDATLGLRAVKDRVLAVSNTLFPDFTLHDYGEEEPGRREDLVPVTQILQPEIMLRTRVFGAQEKLDHARDWLGRFVHAKPAVQIDPRCARLINALAGGYAFRRVHGETGGEPELNAHAYIVDAWLAGLANPIATMTPAEKARLMGPKNLSTWMR